VLCLLLLSLYGAAELLCCCGMGFEAYKWFGVAPTEYVEPIAVHGICMKLAA
jgi:hypothetical protein